MKTICLTILFALIQVLGSAQTNKNANVASKTMHCALEYDGNKWNTIHSGDSTEHQCEELVIGNLPPMSQKLTPVKLDIIYKGNYGLKKNQSLQIPADYSVVIKDIITGEYYNLDSSEPFPFSISRASHQSRLVMEIQFNKENKIVGHLFGGKNTQLF